MRKILKSKLFLYSACFVLSAAMVACKRENNFPKPVGYYRIDLPKERECKTYEGNCSYSFEYPSYSTLVLQNNCNNDLYFPKFNATVYGTYLQLTNSPDNDFFYHSEFSRKLAYEHRIKADRIEELKISNDSNNVYGVVYTIDGNVASNYQFFLTDSNMNFYRGSLYFDISPNIDSVRPVLNHIREDIDHLIQTFSWK